MGTMQLQRLFLKTCGLVGLVLLATAGGALALRAHVAGGEPSLDETRPIEPPVATRGGMPDLWAQLQAATSLLRPDPTDRLEVLAAVGLLAPADLQGRVPQPAAIDAIRSLPSDEGTVLVPMPDSLDGNTPDLLPLQRLCQAWLLDAWERASRGDTAGATKDMLGALRTARLLAEGDSGLLGHIVGLSLEQLALTELRELLTGPARADAEALELAASALALPRDDSALARGIATEFTSLERHFQQLRASSEASSPPWGRLPGAYDPDQTTAWVRVDGQAAVDRALAPRWLRPKAEDTVRWGEAGGSLREWVHNPLGRSLYAVAKPELGDFVVRADSVRAQARVLQAWVALQRARLHTGALPQTLDATVPAWLAAVPVDPFDGGPIRFENGAVASAGHGAIEWSVRSRGRSRGTVREPHPGLEIPLITPEQPLLVHHKIDVELGVGEDIPVPGLDVIAHLVSAKRGHTRSGGAVASGVLRLQHGDEEVERSFDKDGPFEAFGVTWALWGGAAQLSAYPEGAQITP
jgi:hypothetical protein